MPARRPYRLTRTFWWLAAVILPLLTLLAYSLCQVVRIEARYPPAGGFVSVEGVRLHYLTDGAGFGPGGVEDEDAALPIVLLHGASTSLLDFRPTLMPVLAARYPVIAFDRPGHGYSLARDDGWSDPAEQARLIASALHELGIERALWVGHSWAGSVVLAAALNHPEQVAGVVSIAGVSHPWLGPSSWHVELSALPVIGALFRWLFIVPGGQASLESAVSAVLAPDAVPAGYVENTGLALSLRPGAYRHNAWDLTRLGAWLPDQARRYTELGVPVLLITGSQDTVVPPWNHAERLKAQYPAAQHLSLPGAGHAPHHTRATEVSNTIVQFADNLGVGHTQSSDR